MDAKKLFTMSSEGKSEYCCNVVRIGEVKPIENSDFLGQVMIYDKSIVVRKDQVKEGMLMFYASNESQLNKDFLSVNNLFELSEYTQNANGDDIKEIRVLCEEKKNEVKQLNTNKRVFTKYITPLMNEDSLTKEDFEKSLKKINSLYDVDNEYIGDMDNTQRKFYFSIVNDSYITVIDRQIVELENEIDNLFTKMKSNCGFFNKHGRVRMIRLKGVPSMGFLFTQEELGRYNPKVLDINMEEILNMDFDTIDGELFIKAYVPYVQPKREPRSHTSKAQKKIEKFDRMIPGEFHFHYDTNPLGKNMWKIQPTDTVVITNKVHGTSGIFSYIKTRKPRKLIFYKWLWNKFIKITGLFKKYKCIDYDVVYDNVYSSRTVIKNQYINQSVGSGYYKEDVWKKYNDILKGHISEGMCVYGEIAGYQTDSSTMIQKGYDYGCEVGTNFFMPYRITTTDENGKITDWNVLQVKEWTENLIKNNTELASVIKPITIFYHGTLVNLYPQLRIDEHWHEEVLYQLKQDKEHFGMEENEPLCKNIVPREGICIRIDDDPISECFKLKCDLFFEHERGEMDKGNVDSEMLETY